MSKIVYVLNAKIATKKEGFIVFLEVFFYKSHH